MCGQSAAFIIAGDLASSIKLAVKAAVDDGTMSCADRTERCSGVVQDTVDQCLRDRTLPPVMQAVIGGKFAQQIICRGVPYRSEKEEEFYQVLALPLQACRLSIGALGSFVLDTLEVLHFKCFASRDRLESWMPTAHS